MKASGTLIFYFTAVAAMLLLPSSVTAQDVTFSGDVSTYIEGYFSEDDFDSPVYPSNILGLEDLMTRQEAVFKLEGAGSDGSDGFRLWAGLDYYPVGAALEGLALTISDPAENPVPLIVVSELNTALGDSLVTLDVMRLSYTWSPGDLSFTMGRHSFLTGYGYGWNPMDLVSPLKDPSDPEVDMRGVDGITGVWDSGAAVSVRLYGIYNNGGTGADAWGELKGGGELTFFLPGAELKAGALWGKDEEETAARPNGVGAGFLVDILGAGVYAEAAVRQYSRRSVPIETGDVSVSYDLDTSGEWQVSALAGIEYYFPSGTAVISEYFYNGEGYDDEQREMYHDALVSFSDGGVPSAWSMLYYPGFFSRHYALLNLLHSFWDPFQIDLTLTCIGAVDSGAVSAAGSVTIYPSGSLSFVLGYAGLFSLDDEGYNEADLSPFGHALSLSASYSF